MLKNIFHQYPLAFIFSALLLSNCASENREEEKHSPSPNVLLILIDDMGWKDAAYSGSKYYETPNIDNLSKEGMVFVNGYAGASNCAPSRACLLSGLNTPRHGIFTVGNSDRGIDKIRKLIPTKNTLFLEDSVYTLPEMFKSAGYVTGHFGKWHVSKDPTTQGIDVNVAGGVNGGPGGGGYFSPYNVPNIEDGEEGEYLTDRLTNEVISFITKYKDTTFFAYVPYYTVHAPWNSRKDWLEKYKGKKGSEGQSHPEYGGMISAMDENVGRLLSAVKALGLEENTLVIFSSDNGGVRFISHQTPLKAGKGAYYEGGIRVPMIIKWPGVVEAGSTSEERITNMDFYPTLQAIVHPEKKATFLDGVDISPALNGTSLGKRDLFWHFPVYLNAQELGGDDSRDSLFRTRPGSIIISGDWKLHEYFEDGGKELYNLKDDPGESNNLIKENPKKGEELYKKLVDWRKKTNAPVPTDLNPLYDPAFERTLVDLIKTDPQKAEKIYKSN